MGTTIERLSQGETVLTKIKKEGSNMKPSDNICRADLGEGTQCEDEIVYDPSGDQWSIFCADHQKEHIKSLSRKGPKVARIQIS